MQIMWEQVHIHHSSVAMGESMKPDFLWICVLRLQPYLDFLMSHTRCCTFYLSETLTTALNWLPTFGILLGYKSFFFLNFCTSLKCVQYGPKHSKIHRGLSDVQRLCLKPSFCKIRLSILTLTVMEKKERKKQK